MAEKLIHYQMPSSQMLEVHLAEGTEDHKFTTALRNEFARLDSDHKQALSAVQQKHEEQVKALEAEIKKLKGHIASELVLEAKREAGNERFDERAEMDYHMGESADRLIHAANRLKASVRKFAPSLAPPRPGALYADAPGVAVE